MISDILDLSKIEAAEIELYEEEFEIHHVIESSLKLIHASAEENNVIIEYPSLMKTFAYLRTAEGSNKS